MGNINTQSTVNIGIDNSFAVNSLGIPVNEEAIKDVDIQIVLQENFITAQFKLVFVRRVIRLRCGDGSVHTQSVIIKFQFKFFDVEGV